jgi:hypothetical protein
VKLLRKALALNARAFSPCGYPSLFFFVPLRPKTFLFLSYFFVPIPLPPPFYFGFKYLQNLRGNDVGPIAF